MTGAPIVFPGGASGHCHVPTELYVNPGAYHAAEVFAPQAPLSERIWARRYEALL